jgi:uncharacterized membrane protein YoaK (UPF0700 family)
MGRDGLLGAQSWPLNLSGLLPMSSDVSLGRAADPPLHREEALEVAALLAFAGGYLDAYTWIIHRVFANAQSANVVFLWVRATAGQWEEALRYVPSIMAFAVGVVIASWLRHSAGSKAGQISLLIEISMLILVAVLHNRLPHVAGTLGIAMVAAVQTSIFVRVEGMPYSSVMITGNLRQAIEGIFAAAYGVREVGMFRRPGTFATLVVVFGTGAAAGAFMTKETPALTLGIPVIALLAALFCSETERTTGRFP